MRVALAVLLLGCGGPAFVPVTLTINGPVDHLFFAEATRKLNPSCAMNCEMGPTIEDGGCTDTITVTRVDAVHCRDDGGCSTVLRFDVTKCEPGGGYFYPFDGFTFDDRSPPYTSTPRYVSPGTEVRIAAAPDDCHASFVVQTSGLSVIVTTGDGGCSLSER